MANVAKLACGVVCLVCSLGGIVLFVVGVKERVRFDPIYTPVVCRGFESEVSPVTIVSPSTLPDGSAPNETDPVHQALIMQASTFDTDGRVGKECTNPNEMEITLETTRRGPSYVIPQGRDDEILSGEVWATPGTFPAQGVGRASSFSKYSMDYVTTMSILAAGGNSTSISKMYWRSTSTLTMMGMKRTTVREYEQWCGFKACLKLADSIVGPTVCFDTKEELLANVPDYTEPEVPSKVELSKARLEAAEQARDTFLGLVMAMGLLLTCCCCGCGAGCIMKSTRGAGPAKTAPTTTPVEVVTKEAWADEEKATSVVVVAK